MLQTTPNRKWPPIHPQKPIYLNPIQAQIAPGNAAILVLVLVQYLLVNLTHSKLTELMIGLLQNCALNVQVGLTVEKL